MSEFMYDPESLSDALDAMLSDAAPRDEVLLQTAARVVNAPSITLSSTAFARIELQVVDTFNNLPPNPPAIPYPALIGGAIIVVLIVVGILFGVAQNQPAAIVTPAATDTYTVTPLPTTTNTPVPTQTMTSTVVPSETLSPTVTPSETPSSTPSLTSTETATETATTAGVLPIDTNLIVEGTIESINENTIVVYGIEIVIDVNEPLLDVIEIGDSIRVEGQIVEEDGSITIVAVVIVIITDDVAVSEEGDVWRDDGSCDNPPPAWAPAHGWRRRCEGQSQNNGNNGNNGNNRNDDDDDD